ncbi:MAG: multiheme c-type cytochrome [Pyrinomonadaceae bacterium]
MKKTILIRSLVLTTFVVIAVVATVYALRGRYVGLREGKADANYIQSTDCRVCHEDHFSSWRKTHHSRMTQDISPLTVQGDFDTNNSLEYLGVKARMDKTGEGYFMRLAYPDGRNESFKIERTVGSRRIEQYVARKNGQYMRLPLAYDLVNKRWMSLNGSFFYPDGDNFNQHLAQWDTNCVFCHNVKAQPNFNFETRLAKTEVSELGIACGACHGQGAEHAELAASPLKRVLWRMSGRSETKIVDPLELDSDRSMMVCGHCHGQRVPQPMDRIREIMSKGDPYDAGEDLSAFYRPVHKETTIGNVSFASRFWPDGSPRLTAYEYQGILGSACFTKGKPGGRISCTSCHTMHEGDIKGQITEEKRTNVACTQCHGELRDETALKLHTKHEADSSASSCYACHMPEVVYGVQAIHKTHLITIPEPARTVGQGVPNACSQCHVDRSANWAVQQAKALWPEHYKDAQTSSDKQFDIAEGVRGLFGGDALTRALMADAMFKHADRNWAEPFFIEAFRGDNYPIVRYFAANSLAARDPSMHKPDYLGSADARSRQIADWATRVDPARMSEVTGVADMLRKGRKDVDIEVGE